MKTLPEIVSTINGIGSLLSELASDLEELQRFFGVVVSTHAVPATVQPTPAEPPTQPKSKRQYNKRGTSTDPRCVGHRTMTMDEKRAVRKDWESLPEHLRTTDNRSALALKHRCSLMQVVALLNNLGQMTPRDDAPSARRATQ